MSNITTRKSNPFKSNPENVSGNSPTSDDCFDEYINYPEDESSNPSSSSSSSSLMCSTFISILTTPLEGHSGSSSTSGEGTSYTSISKQALAADVLCFEPFISNHALPIVHTDTIADTNLIASSSSSSPSSSSSSPSSSSSSSSSFSSLSSSSSSSSSAPSSSLESQGTPGTDEISNSNAAVSSSPKKRKKMRGLAGFGSPRKKCKRGVNVVVGLSTKKGKKGGLAVDSSSTEKTKMKIKRKGFQFKYKLDSALIYNLLIDIRQECLSKHYGNARTTVYDPKDQLDNLLLIDKNHLERHRGPVTNLVKSEHPYQTGLEMAAYTLSRLSGRTATTAFNFDVNGYKSDLRNFIHDIGDKLIGGLISGWLPGSVFENHAINRRLSGRTPCGLFSCQLVDHYIVYDSKSYESTPVASLIISNESGSIRISAIVQISKPSLDIPNNLRTIIFDEGRELQKSTFCKLMEQLNSIIHQRKEPSAALIIEEDVFNRLIIREEERPSFDKIDIVLLPRRFQSHLPLGHLAESIKDNLNLSSPQFVSTRLSTILSSLSQSDGETNKRKFNALKSCVGIE